MKAKHLLITLLVILSTLTAKAIDTTKIAERWKITKYAKKTHVIPHKEDDFMQFDVAGHSYEQVLEGVYSKGKWSLNGATGTLTIIAGGETHVWTLTELTAHHLKAT